MNVFRTKSVEQSIADTDEPEHQLKKSLGALDLVVFGVGVIIGAGHLRADRPVAATNAGPAMAISFMIAALACALAALCYAEFASTVPVAGQRLHVLLRHRRRAGRLDHRLGPAAGVDARRGGGRRGCSGYLADVLDRHAVGAGPSSSGGDGFNLPAVLSRAGADRADPAASSCRAGSTRSRGHQGGRGRSSSSWPASASSNRQLHAVRPRRARRRRPGLAAHCR